MFFGVIMKDKSDNKTLNLLASKNAQIQAAYKARMRAQGYKQKAVWIHEESYRNGVETAKSGGLLTDFSADDDAASFAAGFCSVAVEHEKLMRNARSNVAKSNAD